MVSGALTACSLLNLQITAPSPLLISCSTENVFHWNPLLPSSLQGTVSHFQAAHSPPPRSPPSRSPSGQVCSSERNGQVWLTKHGKTTQGWCSLLQDLSSYKGVPCPFDLQSESQIPSPRSVFTNKVLLTQSCLFLWLPQSLNYLLSGPSQERITNP